MMKRIAPAFALAGVLALTATGVQAQTKRIYSILYSERHENRATVKAGDG